jgi:molecular chaperone GrpE
LDKQGVKRIDAKDKEFDFNFHEALMRQESKDYPPDTVITVLDNGYMYKDKVIKHAKVVVSAAPAEEETATDENKANNEEE